jgi:ubiquinone/menaquinone biosynthesis C-methylase UbiE
MLNVQRKPYKGLAMEGVIAGWYAKNTGRDLSPFQALAARLAERLAPGAKILEIAPGPGYLAIALARFRRYDITGLDISRSFVTIATENAAKAGVAVDFRVGDAAALPFADASFDFIVCRAAFKNFSDPIKALREMQRVLKPAGQALVIDLRKDACGAAIDREVRDMNLPWLSGVAHQVTSKILDELRFRRTKSNRKKRKCEGYRVHPICCLRVLCIERFT